MERNREARRGSMAAMNGGGHQRRRQRGSGLRDSPEDDAAIEMPETTRLRDRASKRDRERDRSSRSKRRRGERMMHGGVRDEGEESSEESVDDEDDEEEDDPSMTHRPPPPPPAAASSPAPSSSSASQNAHLRRSLPSAAGKPLRPPPPVWKVADEMIGVSVPRKARSASGKRSQDSWASGGGGGGDPIHRQASTSPARPSTASAAQVSPSSSNVSIRKKMMKPTAGATQRPPKSSKPSSAQEDIEFEVAEVLFGMTRQVHCTSKQEINKVDSKDATGSIGDGKSGASSPISQSSAQHQRDHFSNQGTTAPKRKRPRPVPVKFDDESPTSPLSSVALPATSTVSTAKLEPEEQQPSKAEDSMVPRSEKMPSQAIDNGSRLPDLPVSHSKVAAIDSQQDLATRSEKNQDLDAKVLTGEPDSSAQTPAERKEEAVSTQKDVSPAALDVNVIESKNAKRNSDVASDKPKEEKFSIDLMAPPPGKLSPEREDYVPIHKPLDPQNELVSKLGDSRREEKIDTKPVSADSPLEGRKDKPVIEELNLKKQSGKERTLDLQLDLENSEREGKDPSQKQQQFKATAKADPKPEKSVPPATSMPLPMPVSGWPGNLPPFGYMSQIPPLQPVLPMDASAGSSKPLQPINFLPPQRPKRCATHCYIAQTIRYHQQLAKMNPFWPAAASTMQLYGAKPYNLNALPPSESAAVLGNPLQGNLTGRNVASLQDKGSAPVIAGYMSNSTREKTSTVNSSLMEAAQRKQFVVQQAPQPASANSMLGPALIFPLNQHQAAAAAASTGRPPATKTTSASGIAASSSSATGNTGMASYGTGGPAPALNISYPSLPPNEAQYLAILQNNGYPFPVPAHVGTAPYRGAAPAQAMPFYGGPFYSSQMIHPSQLQQQQAPQQPPHAQHGHQNTSTSSGSSSSQKQPKHTQRVPGGGPATAGGSSHSFPVSKQGQHLSETGCEESSLATDTRASQGQKSSHAHNFALPIHHQNFALISPAAALGGVGVNHNEKHQATQHPVIKMELTPSQAYAMSFASLTGAAAAAAAAGPQGIDFSALAQNHALFQSLPEGARHGYQMAAAVQAAQQHKKAHHQEDGKSVVEPMNSTAAIEEERKMMTSSKAPMSGSQQSLAFSRQDSETPISSILSNSVMDSSSRTLNLIPAVGNGGRTPIRSANATQTTAAGTAAASSPNSQQQHLIQLQKQQQQQHQHQHQQHQLQQQQQQIQLQHQLTSRAKTSASSNNAGVYSERMQAVTKFPQTLSGFPQTLIQSGGSPSQSSQWNASSRSAGTPVPSTAAPSSSGKSQLHQHQNRIPQQSPTSTHQTQISFGVNPLKMAVGPSGQSSMPSLSSSTSMVVGSFPNSVNKSGGGGSPQASLNGKSVPPVSTTPPLQHQVSDKNSQSSSSLKPSPMSNRNMPSVLGHPHITPAPSSSSSSSSKQQQQQQRQTQPQQKQPYPQAQFFFSNAYMPSQSAQSNASAAAAAAYYQRHQTELQSQQSQQHASNPMGVLSVCSSALTLSAPPATNDPTKAMAASAAAAAANMKGLAAPGLLQHPSQQASAGSYPFISAAAAGFPYIHAMPTVSVKAPEQKPPAGNDSLNASWPPEKR